VAIPLVCNAQAEPPPPTQILVRSDSSQTTLVDSLDQVVQRDIVDVLAHWIFGRRIEPVLEGQARSGLSWSVLPSLSYNPVYGFAFGATASGAGQFGTGPHSRPSAFSLSGNYSTKGQTQALARIETTSASGGYLTKLDFRYLDTERSTWGLGPISDDQQEYPMAYVLLRTYVTFYRRTSGPVYVGLGYHLDHFQDIRDTRAELGEETPFRTYSGPDVTKTRASGVSLNLLADTRDSIVNARSGYLISGSFRAYMESLGADRNWQEFLVSVRMYPRLPSRSNNVLAFWLYSWLTFGKGPYHNLPATGWDTYGRGARGYLQGRIRAANQIYLESEYRFGLTRDGLLGGVVFLNGTASAGPAETFGSLDTGGGLGIRIKFNKDSRTNLALDRAWGRAGSGGWFMGMSEVF
jgi:outer membrane protein assembly factor BamA